MLPQSAMPTQPAAPRPWHQARRRATTTRDPAGYGKSTAGPTARGGTAGPFPGGGCPPAAPGLRFPRLLTAQTAQRAVAALPRGTGLTCTSVSPRATRYAYKPDTDDRRRAIVRADRPDSRSASRTTL